ncbi:hypothetical protein A6R68_13077, partial [Neotoma lepida]
VLRIPDIKNDTVRTRPGVHDCLVQRKQMITDVCHPGKATTIEPKHGLVRDMDCMRIKRPQESRERKHKNRTME